MKFGKEKSVGMRGAWLAFLGWAKKQNLVGWQAVSDQRDTMAGWQLFISEFSYIDGTNRLFSDFSPL